MCLSKLSSKRSGSNMATNSTSAGPAPSSTEDGGSISTETSGRPTSDTTGGLGSNNNCSPPPPPGTMTPSSTTNGFSSPPAVDIYHPHTSAVVAPGHHGLWEFGNPDIGYEQLAAAGG